jgi:hypothetical protein
VSLRIRVNGEIVCAAMHPEEPGDTYIPDGISYRLTVEHHVIVTDKNHLDRPGHKGHGLWWWADEVPEGIKVDDWWAVAE